MLSQVLSGIVVGIEAHLIEVQCDVSGGLPSFHIVGLPEKEISESRERIRSAIKNSGFRFPPGRITANLAPADLRKEGVGFDLPIAVAILMATQQISDHGRRYLYLGELALSGEVRSVRGVLPIAMETAPPIDGIIVAQENSQEAAVASRVPVYPVRTLIETRGHLAGESPIAPVEVKRSALLEDPPAGQGRDLAEVRGQPQAKRALEIAAAGGHNLLMVGPPGSGKSMLAACLPEILPRLTFEEALEVTRIYSASGMLETGQALVRQRPFRAPHHTISYAGMVGGGHGVPGPGEISLAHHGVLFLDELPEFDRRVLETLRQPLEERSILISRAGIAVRYPASFTLVAAMNPCPCGFLGDSARPCTCSPGHLHRYRHRLSGPFLDRVDLRVEVPRLTTEELMGVGSGERSAVVRDRIVTARERQKARTASGALWRENAQLDGKLLREQCCLTPSANALLRRACTRFGLSARAHVRILRVARTIADLAGEEILLDAHVAEAIGLRTTRTHAADG
jgi:magnesium chelatase family protein